MDNGLIQVYIDRFVNHRGAYYQQWSNGISYGYTAIHELVTTDLVQAHLSGDITCAWPALDENNCGKWLCIDSDRESDDLDKMHSFLERYRWSVVREGARAGRAGHLFLFFDGLIPGVQLRILGKTILRFAGVNERDIELFPKQAQAGKLSNPVRGPLGVHLKPGASNCRGWFAGVEQDVTTQLEWLAQQPLNNAAAAIELAYKHRQIPKPRIMRSNYSKDSNGRSRFDFLRYAQDNGFELSGDWYVGPCPACKSEIHDADDNHLGINVTTGGVNCWRCSFGNVLAAIRKPGQ